MTYVSEICIIGKRCCKLELRLYARRTRLVPQIEIGKVLVPLGYLILSLNILSLLRKGWKLISFHKSLLKQKCNLFAL